MTNIKKKQITFFLAAYFASRVFSYFFTPATPLWAGSIANSAIALIIFVCALYLIIRGDNKGWIIVAAELILGGSGGYLSIGPIALRTALLSASSFVIIAQNMLFTRRPAAIWLLITWGCIAAANGLIHGHNEGLVFADIIPYFFLLYFFGLKKLLADTQTRSLLFSMIISAIIGNVLFTLFSFTGFSSQIFILQDNYYHWFRDVAGGKITDFANGFFRVTLNEHLLVVPLLLFAAYKLMADKFKFFPHLILWLSLLTILCVNITRVYLLAMVIGLVFLFSKVYWKKWLLVCSATLVTFLSIFTLINLSATRGTDTGLGMFGIRLSSIAKPHIEESSLSRILLLPNIFNKIISNPIIGAGLGGAVTVYSPVFEETITTPHFDWGYLEIIAETGVVGLIIWALFLILVFKRINKSGTMRPLYLAQVISLLVINLTSPALFHVLGVVFIIAILCLSDSASQAQSA